MQHRRMRPSRNPVSDLFSFISAPPRQLPLAIAVADFVARYRLACQVPEGPSISKGDAKKTAPQDSRDSYTMNNRLKEGSQNAFRRNRRFFHLAPRLSTMSSFIVTTASPSTPACRDSFSMPQIVSCSRCRSDWHFGWSVLPTALSGSSCTTHSGI